MTCLFPCERGTGCTACYPPEPKSEQPKEPPRRPTQVRRAARMRIGDRDGWICGVCRTSIDRNLRWPHPLSPSTGHILWVGFGAGGTDDESNLRIEHLACNMYSVPQLLFSTLSGGAKDRREEAGLPPHTEEERKQIIAQALEEPGPALPVEAAVRRYWSFRYPAWKRWHTENPGACSCTDDVPSTLCLPDAEGFEDPQEVAAFDRQF